MINKIKHKVSSFAHLMLYNSGLLAHNTQVNWDEVDRFTLSDDEVPALLCGAKVLALPRPDSHQARGGFPTKLGEYLSTGNPVCVTSVGEIPDYLIDKESAFVAKPGDVDSFAEALDEALADNEKAKQVALNGQKVAENVFSSTARSIRLYNFLISNAK